MAANQNLLDLFDQLAGRPPTADELARFADSSDYAVGQYIRSLNEYSTSHEYLDRYAEIQSMARDMFGYDLDAVSINQWIRHGVTDNELVFQWRNSEQYRQLYPDIPAGMSEKEYRTINAKLQLEGAVAKEDFALYGGQPISDQQLRQIYFGGAGTDALRRQWVQVQGMKAAKEAERGKLLSTAVTQTTLGPTQQLMAGFSSAASSGAAYSGRDVNSREVPITEKHTSYKDYKEGIINPAFSNSGKSNMSGIV